ncbi:MAG: hypothetical protein IKJ34_01070, partial [Mailhella sp.]|nr:hypothetical protein [Mailhella sp.]
MVQAIGPFYDVSSRDLNGDAPLHIARSQDVAQWLIHHGARADAQNKHGKFPYETMHDENLAAWLEQEYLALHPLVEEALSPAAPAEIPWESRFVTRTLSIDELKPVSVSTGVGFQLEYEGELLCPSPRFIESFAKRLKFSSNIFRLFSAEEVFGRIRERMPDTTLKTTFDLQENTVLGVVDGAKKMLPPEQALKVILNDSRLKEVNYHEGVWEARFEMEERFEVVGDSPYTPTFWLDYPVDGLGSASIVLGVLRQICSNGQRAMSRGFRTDIEINDNYGMHLAKLLASYSNDTGFHSLRMRLDSAQHTKASVAELQQVSSLLTTNVENKTELRALLARLEEMAGDPCSTYKVTSLKNISAKKARLLPVECSVNDLFIFCSELTTHHPRSIRSQEGFHGMLGNMLSQEFDL